jgi:hypothetical protein
MNGTAHTAFGRSIAPDGPAYPAAAISVCER